MKQGFLRKAAVAVLAGAMVLSCASCALLQGAGEKDKEEIIDLANDVAKALVKMDGEKVVKFADDFDSDDNPDFANALLETREFTENDVVLINTIADTLKYEIDEDSVNIDKDKASVDVTFTMVDYETVIESGDYSDIDEVVAALQESDDTKEVEITFEFTKDGDDWVLSNLDDKAYGKLYDFCFYEADLGPDLTSLITSTEILDGSYCIDAYIYFSEDISGYDAQFTFDVFYEGVPIASDVDAYVIGTYVWCDYCDPNCEDLASGEYEFAVKCNGADLTSMTITMVNEEIQPTSSTASGVVSTDVVYSAYREVLKEYEDKMRTVENVQYCAMDSCAILDLTGDGIPELLIQYSSDEENGIYVSSDYYNVTDIKIFTVIPGETEASEMLHIENTTVNAGGGTSTDVILLTTGNLLVRTDGGDEAWDWTYTEYTLDGYTFEAIATLNKYEYPNEDYTSDIVEYTIDGTEVAEVEFNSVVDTYIGNFSNVLAMSPYYSSEYASDDSWKNSLFAAQSNILSYDEAWEVTS